MLFMQKLIPILFALMVHGAASAQKKNNKYKDGVKIEKGMKFASLNFSTASKKATNETGLLAYYLNQDKSSLGVRFDPGYVFKENLAVGLGLLYEYRRDINTQQASDGTISNNRSYGRDFAFRPFIKNFIPIGNSHKIYVVIPAELQIGYGSKVSESEVNSVLTRTYSETRYYGLQLRPGLLAFVVDNFGFEVNVGAFGLSTSKEKIKTTDKPDGEIKNRDLSLRIDLLQLSLGFALYFR